MAWTKQQQEAIDLFGTNMLVSAGAGSGKTAVLTSRIVNHLDMMNIDELLVLTFTEAAASEMKERIRSELIKNQMTNQLELIDQAYITTFDSFNLSVVRKYHYLINVKRDIAIADGSMMMLYKENILDDVFNEFYGNISDDFSRLLSDFTNKDDRVIKEAVFNINNNLDLRYDKVDYLKNYVEEYFSKDNINRLVNEYINVLNEESMNIIPLMKDLLGYSSEKNIKVINAGLCFLEDDHSYDELVNFYSTYSFPRLPNGSLDEVKSANKAVKDAFTKVKEKLIYANTLELYNQFEELKIYQSVIIDLVLSFDEKIAGFKFERDLYEFNDVAKLALRLVSDFDVVRFDLSNKFKEILIDEYQDTSDLQEAFISKIGNDNIYCVGDIKQSIYRFRNANPYIFEDKYQRFGKTDGGIKIDLLENFRSRKEVLEDINLLFNDLMSIDYGNADYKNGHYMRAGNLNYESSSDDFYHMEVLNYEKEEYSNEEYEAFIIGNKIKEYIDCNKSVFNKKTNLLEKVNYNDFAILLDRSTSFDLYRKVFNYLQIPIDVYKEEVLTASFILKVISAIFNLVCLYPNKNDEYKFNYASVYRSFLVGNCDNKLLESMMNYCNDDYVEPIIKELNKSVHLLSPLAIYYKVIEKFDVYNKLISLPEVQNSLYHLEYLHDITKNLCSSGYDIFEISKYYNDILTKNYDLKVSGNIGNSGVKLMTIHKSKGLEFPYVFFAGLTKPFNIRQMSELIGFSNDYGIVTPYFSEGIKDSFVKTLVKKQYIVEEVSEKIRLFYVATTRAKEKMFFVCPSFTDCKEKAKIDMRSFYDFMYFNYDVLEQYFVSAKCENITRAYQVNIEKDYAKYIIKENESINQRSMVKEEVTAKRISKDMFVVMDNNLKKNVDFGLRLHQVLETIDLKNPKLDDLNLSEREHDIISKVLNIELFKNLNDKIVHQELEFMYDKDNLTYHGIIDLCLETDDEVIIIDYKLKNTTSEDYVTQLNTYKEYLHSMTKKPVKTYLLSIIEAKLTEVC